MVKKWIDADKVISTISDIPKDLREYDIMMREKPNFNKNKMNLKNMNKKEGNPRIK